MEGQTNNLLFVVIIVAMSISLVSSIPFIGIVVKAQSTEPAQDTWRSVASMPTVRAQLGVAVVNGKIYAIGGSNDGPRGGPSGPTLLNVTEEYDPVANTWTTKAPMPTARHSFGIAVFQNKIFCIGGSTNGPELAVNEAYDPATDAWETKTPMPTARAALSANTVNDKIYLMGGYPANTTNEAYDPSTDSWTTHAQIPIDSFYSESAVVNNKIYLFGGLSNGNSAQIYDPETDTWTFGAPIPTGVAEGAAVATAGANVPVRIYLVGGDTTYVRNGHTFGNVTDLNQVYDPESNTWSVGAQLPIQLRFFGLANVNDTLYVIGGMPKLIGFLDTSYQYIPIGYGTSGQESTPLLRDYVFFALVAIAIALIAAVILTILCRRRGCTKVSRARSLCTALNFS